MAMSTTIADSLFVGDLPATGQFNVSPVVNSRGGNTCQHRGRHRLRWPEPSTHHQRLLALHVVKRELAFEFPEQTLAGFQDSFATHAGHGARRDTAAQRTCSNERISVLLRPARTSLPEKDRASEQNHAGTCDPGLLGRHVRRTKRPNKVIIGSLGLCSGRREGRLPLPLDADHRTIPDEALTGTSRTPVPRPPCRASLSRGRVRGSAHSF